MNDKSQMVEYHYDAAAEGYEEQYERDTLYDLTKDYPANYFRLQLLLNAFIGKRLRKVIEVGVGEGTPLATLGKAGMEVWGFDISKEMVKKAKKTMVASSLPAENIFWGDVQDPMTYVHALKGGQFDGLIAMGIMPHIAKDDMVIENMSALVHPGGSVFVEFRNKLFSLFTMNAYTVDFIVNDLLRDVDPATKDIVRSDLGSRLRTDMPPRRDRLGNAPGYDAILSRFHNPFEVIALFERHGFEDVKLHWYHYHAAMPFLESQAREAFRRESIKLEHEASNWRGMFLCSAFTVEATKSAR